MAQKAYVPTRHRKNAMEIKRFIGLCNWYRRFIPSFSKSVSLMNNLRKGWKKKQEVLSNDQMEKAYTSVKGALIVVPDCSQPLQCDSSNTDVDMC